jgi:hypothetical protein
VSQSAG